MGRRTVKEKRDAVQVEGPGQVHVREHAEDREEVGEEDAKRQAAPRARAKEDEVRRVDALTMDGLDSAFVGFAQQWGQPVLAVYDRDKCIDAFVKRDGMTRDEALEWCEFNVFCAWHGKGTPLILQRCTAREFRRMARDGEI